MNTLLTKVKHARITTREVLIHLRKNGELKRKQYLKYLKMQYRMAGNAYEILQSAANRVENQTESLNALYNKKSAMPVNLVKSELSSMSRSFDEITFLAEAWRFYQKEQMKEDATGMIDIYPVSDFAGNFLPKDENSTKQTAKLALNNPETCQHFTNKSSPHTNPQTQKIPTLTSGFGQLNLHNNNSGSGTPLCIQILKWAQEGKLNLN